MDWPISAESRSNTSRGTTSAALPAPNGIVARISRDGQFSACDAAAETHDKTIIHGMYLRITASVHIRSAAKGQSRYPTNVNCSSKVRWIIKKLSSETI